MKKEYKSVLLPEGKRELEFQVFDKEDLKRVKRIYSNWRILCTDTEYLESRKINIPEALSEVAICIEMGWDRLNKTKTKGGSCDTSWDCYDHHQKKRIQVKATSVEEDLTSFGPRSTWDELYFLDFYREGLWDFSYDIYRIKMNSEEIEKIQVNKNETVGDQKKANRRPRFSIKKEIIERYKIPLFKTASLSS